MGSVLFASCSCPSFSHRDNGWTTLHCNRKCKSTIRCQKFMFSSVFKILGEIALRRTKSDDQQTDSHTMIFFSVFSRSGDSQSMSNLSFLSWFLLLSLTASFSENDWDPLLSQAPDLMPSIGGFEVASNQWKSNGNRKQQLLSGFYDEYFKQTAKDKLTICKWNTSQT